MKKIEIVVFALLILTACGGNKKNKQSIIPEEPQQQQTEVNKYMNHPGRMVYNQVCLVCHQADGQGTPGMHPPLVKNEVVLGDNDKFISVILNGMSGQVKIAGEMYNNVMPPQPQLSDKQIADVITYVRLKYNGLDKPVTPEEVAKLRK